MKAWILLLGLVTPTTLLSQTFYTCKEPDGSTRYDLKPCGDVATAVEIDTPEKASPTRKRRTVYMYMTTKEVIKAWGAPDRKHKSVGNGPVREQWVWRRGPGKSQYVYFSNGLVTGWGD
ncbi:MAG: hypothetical protein AB2747_05460 [Candidatus Thiodiazotropha taylori]